MKIVKYFGYLLVGNPLPSF